MSLLDPLGLCRSAWRDLVTLLNAAAVIVAGLAVSVPTLAAGFLAVLPAPLRGRLWWLLPVWFVIVQAAAEADRRRRARQGIGR